jgi:tripartite-type tricarboxylate transporter receptor subunit TctC
MMLAGLAVTPVAAQEFPTQPITIVVPGAAGGGGDFVGRLLAEKMSQELTQPVIVENRPGSNGNLAASYVSRATADGHTLLLAYSGSHVANPSLFPNLGWDPVESFEPIALAVKAPHVIVVRKGLPVDTLAELIAYAKEHPGEITFATSGIGSIQHIGTVQLARHAGVEMLHIPYGGAGPAMNDMLGERVDLIVTTPPAVVGHLQAGAVKALAIASAERHPMLPDVPTTAEAGIEGFELEAWFGLYAPVGTPEGAIETLGAAAEAAIKSDDFKSRAQGSGTQAAYMGPSEFAKFTRSELDFWAQVIKETGIKIE